VSADPTLIELLGELSDYPANDGDQSEISANDEEYAGVVVPFRLIVGPATLSFFSTTTIFGTPVDITLSELAIESFFPADRATAAVLAR
jgi:hypothetical protein